jgi:hypothetical protein
MALPFDETSFNVPALPAVTFLYFRGILLLRPVFHIKPLNGSEAKFLGELFFVVFFLIFLKKKG